MVRLLSEAEFEKVFKAHFKELHAYVYSFIKDWDIAKEIVQDLFLKLWEKDELPDFYVSVKAYLYKSAYHNSLNYMRKQKVHVRYQTRTAYALKDESDNAANKLNHKEAQGRLSAALNKLPERCKTIFYMSRFDELKYRQIAEELGISIKTVEAQMVKALKVLRAEMKDFLPIIILLLFKIFKP